jgi:phosphopantothenoylcysteine decarboxylase/phosphopantothenate--cysteine ligase
MNKNIVLGITGGIASYKMVDVASKLVKQDFNVDVVMTEAATKFVKPLTFRSITHAPVETDMFSPPVHYEVKHVSLAKKADLFLIGPATGNIIGKIANGIADDLLSTIIMATNAPVIIAPAMNVNMYNNTIVQDNITYLEKMGYKIINPGSGYLACGDIGKGRLPQTELLVEHILKDTQEKDLAGKNVLITAGPTQEPVDQVRYLTNYSTGKMGYELARKANYRGANVTLVTGPTNLQEPLETDVKQIKTAIEMKKEVSKIAHKQDIIIKAAAVSDYRPSNYYNKKLKKDNLLEEIKLTTNPDILEELGKNKQKNQVLVGFAAESNDLIINGRKKLEKKNLDMIVVNDISKAETGFASDENKIAILTSKGAQDIPVMSKRKLADIILDEVIDVL